MFESFLDDDNYDSGVVYVDFWTCNCDYIVNWLNVTITFIAMFLLKFKSIVFIRV